MSGVYYGIAVDFGRFLFTLFHCVALEQLSLFIESVALKNFLILFSDNIVRKAKFK